MLEYVMLLASLKQTDYGIEVEWHDGRVAQA